MKRAIALALALCASLVASAGFAYLGRGQAHVVVPEQLSAVHDAEEALAIAAGLAVLDHGTTEELAFDRDVPLEAGECVALVATLSGPERLASVRIALPSGRVAEGRDGSYSTRLAHVAVCSRTASIAAISARAEPSRAPYAPSRLRFSILRGTPTRPREYVRLDVTPEERAVFDAEAVRGRLAAVRPGRELVPPVAISRQAALVSPAGTATFAALRALVGRAGVVPAIDPTLAARDPFRAASEATIPPRVFAESGPVRALAALDVGALAVEHGVPCVTVLFARLDDPRTPVPIRRIDVPSQAESVLAQEDAAIAIDAVCPQRGLYVYVTDESAGGDYLLTVRASEGPGGTRPAEPSPFGAPPPRGALPPTVTRLPVALVARVRAECEAAAVASCLRWAELAAAGIDGAGDAQAPLARACDLAGGDACDRLATILARAGGERAADVPERRACETGSAAACLRRAARFREIGRFEEAFRTYRHGCTQSCAECCAAAGTMEEWQLAAASSAAPTALP